VNVEYVELTVMDVDLFTWHHDAAATNTTVSCMPPVELRLDIGSEEEWLMPGRHRIFISSNVLTAVGIQTNEKNRVSLSDQI
jgi:hypothetical protein